MGKIFLIEKSYLIRLALKNLIQSVNNYEIIEASSAGEIYSKIPNSSGSVFFVSDELISDNFIKKIKGKNSKLIIISPSSKNLILADDYIYMNDSKELLYQKLNSLLDKNNSIKETDPTLSKREIDILKYVALGLTNKEIADKLFISSHTVITHRKNISAKLGIKTIAGFTVYALLNKIITAEDTKD